MTGFAFTIGAVKDLSDRCPAHDIDRLTELFENDNVGTTLENMAWFVHVLNKWYTYKTTRSFDGCLTEDDVLAMDVKEVRSLFDEAMISFRRDAKPTTEVEPTKKDGAAPRN